MSKLQPKKRVAPKRDVKGNLNKDFRETGVEPSFYLGDVQTQAKALTAYFQMWNTFCENTPGMGHQAVDPQKPIRTMLRRVSKHYGAMTKYNGDGSLRKDYFK
jgi:hypothetical protein